MGRTDMEDGRWKIKDEQSPLKQVNQTSGVKRLSLRLQDLVWTWRQTVGGYHSHRPQPAFACLLPSLAVKVGGKADRPANLLAVLAWE